MQIWSPSTLVYVGAVLAASGTLWSSLKQKDTSDRVIALQNAVIMFNKGSDRFDYLPKPKSADNDGAYVITIANLSAYPVYDAFVNIIPDIDKGHDVLHEKIYEEIGNVGPFVMKDLKTRLKPGYYQIDYGVAAERPSKCCIFLKVNLAPIPTL